MKATIFRFNNSEPEEVIEEPPSLEPGVILRQKTSDKDWNDWRWQLKHRITSFPVEINNDFPASITPYYYLLTKYPEIAKCVVPSMEETLDGGVEDPLCEEQASPVNGIIHRYPNRVLFLVTGFCSSNCRYCTRSRMVGKKGELSEEDLERAYLYIEKNPQIEDVILSGGDPLTMETGKLEQILRRLKFIPHIKVIRIGTKVPVVLPMRIDKELVNMLKKYSPLYLNIHFSHPREITEEVKGACEMLADNGIVLGSQTVLLKDINDDIETMKDLMMRLVTIRVRPYYLYNMDRIKGGNHFASTIKKGKEIIQALEWSITGFAIPKFVVDSPIGKIPVSIDSMTRKKDGKILLNNHHGGEYLY